jgi:nucleoside-triphosphatase
MKSAYLLTGMPGTGKTTLIKEAISGLGDKAGGFFTEEIRSGVSVGGIRHGGIRRGFRIVTLDGRISPLAGVDIRSPYRVSKYGVDVRGLEEVGVAALQKASQECEIIVIDEIGKMELFSEKFKSTVLEIIESGRKVLGTIMLKPDLGRQPQAETSGAANHCYAPQPPGSVILNPTMAVLILQY